MVQETEATRAALERATGADATERLTRAKSLVPGAITLHGQALWNAAVAKFSAGTQASLKPPPVLASRAYYKLKEILLSCSLPKSVRSLHLGEAPGGFVQALATHAQADWKWMAISLSCPGAPEPHPSALPPGGRFEADLPHGGDLLEPECREEVVRRVGSETVDTVTADGARGMDHSQLEHEHLELLYAQTDVAVKALRSGGVYVCKFYEASTWETQRWIATLTTRFMRVSIMKPSWSRPSNSERYLVCVGFEGDASPLRRDQCPCSAWQDSLMCVTRRHASEQAQVLERILMSLGVSA